MQPLVVFDTQQVPVEPGAETRLGIRVRNPGTIVEAYRLDVVGAAAPWARAEPDIVSVYPGQEVEAEIVFHPPLATTTPLGLLPFGVRAVSDVDPSQSVVEEGELEIGGVVDLDAVLLPRNSKGRWRGKHRIEIENNGNAPIRLGVSANDQDEQLSFRMKPDVVDLAVGDFAVAKLKAKIRSPYLRGPATPRAFQVTLTEVESDELSRRRISRGDAHTETLDGAVGQRQIIGGSLVAITALIALAVGGFFALQALNSNDDTGGEAGQAVPRPPAGLAVTARGVDGVRLTWDSPTGDEQGFDVLEIVDGASRTLQANLPRGDSTYDATGLEPATEYCFSLRSFNAVGRSDPSGERCATTAEPEALPVPPAPIGVTVDLGAEDDGEADRVTIAWTDVTESGAETVLSENGTPLLSIPAGRNTIELGRPPGEWCYEVRSVVDGVQSAPATEGAASRFCVDVPAPAPPPPVVEPGTLGWFIRLGSLIEIGEPFVLDQQTALGLVVIPVPGQAGETTLAIPSPIADGLETAEAQLVQAQQNGHRGAIIVNSTHVGIPGDDSWVVIVPGFATEEDAQEYCAQKNEPACITFESG